MRVSDCICLIKIYEETKNWKVATSTLEIMKLGRVHMLQYAELGVGHDDPCCLGIVPKHHLFMCCLESSRGNPGLDWCYNDESEIGECAAVCKSCNPLHIATSLIRKYRATFEK